VVHILFVEDDVDVRTAIEHVLLSEGHTINAVATLKEGSELLHSNDYDLVLVDGRLPDGVGTVLADQAVARNVPALLITAYAFILSEMAANPSRYHFLLKPVRPSELITALDRVLAIKRR
jgi:two-component system, NtrC family, response regulator HydG